MKRVCKYLGRRINFADNVVRLRLLPVRVIYRSKPTLWGRLKKGLGLIDD